MEKIFITAYHLNDSGLEPIPIQIQVSTPQPNDFNCFSSEVYCPLLQSHKKIHGETEEQAFYLGIKFIAEIIEYSGIELFHEDGTPFSITTILSAM